MSAAGLSERELELMRAVFRRVEGIREVILFGSRAKGSHRPESDVDMALVGISDDLTAEAVAELLESLAMPYRFDLKAYDSIEYAPVKEHIRRVGVVIYQRGVHDPSKDEGLDAAIVAGLRDLGYER